MTNLLADEPMPPAIGPDAANLERGFPTSLGLADPLQDQDRNERLQRTVLDLFNIQRDCSAEDWDGYGARPISLEATMEAVRLLHCLPARVPIPDVEPLPSGDLGLEWYASKGTRLSLSVAGRRQIVYACLLGPEGHSYGTMAFFDRIPSEIGHYLSRLLD